MSDKVYNKKQKLKIKLGTLDNIVEFNSPRSQYTTILNEQTLIKKCLKIIYYTYKENLIKWNMIHYNMIIYKLYI